MFDRFSFPNITGDSADEKIAQIYNYLLQLKEELEFELGSIDDENLSASFSKRLSELGADIQKSNDDRDDQLQQFATNSLTVSDVINSALFKATIEGIKEEVAEEITFTVNYSTGNLEYTT